MSSSSEESSLVKVQFFNDQLLTVPQFDFFWTLNMAVRLELFQQAALLRLVKPPVNFVLLVCCYRLYLLLPLSPLTPKGVYSFGGVGLASYGDLRAKFCVLRDFFFQILPEYTAAVSRYYK